MFEVERKILLNPGPGTTTDSVKAAQVVPDICPREEEFCALMREVRSLLLEVAHAEELYDVVLIPGSGTAILEATVSSVVPDDGRILILRNGSYGERLYQIATLHYGESRVDSITIPDTETFDVSELARTLDTGDFSHVAVVHNETCTGMRNPIEAIYQCCADRNIEMIVDAMSSFGGIPMELPKNQYDYVISSSNKCVQGMAGLGFVLAKKSSLEGLKDIPRKSFYLSLYDHYEFISRKGQMRFTPPVQVFYALRQALLELKEETIKGRYDRYTENWETLLAGLETLNLKPLLPREMHSRIVTSIIEPENPGYDFRVFHDRLYRNNITVYPGIAGEKPNFRISVLGALTKADIEHVLGHVREYFSSL